MTLWHRLGLAAVFSLLFAVTPAAARNATPPETAPTPQSAAPAPTPVPVPSSVSTPVPTPSATAVVYGTTATAPPGPEADRVGVLSSGGHHFCTASVIDSPGGTLALTAAHCLDTPEGVTFTPAYRNGTAPYGTWTVTAVHTTDAWQDSEDPDADFALLEIAPDPATGRTVQSVLGGTPVDFAAPLTATARLYGYPARTETPILCTNTTTAQSPTQRRIDCPSYPGGTSGGPFVDTTTGHLIGIIGGHQQGGDTEDTSYSPALGAALRTLYEDVTT
ncbi:trypsin-like peptidase domain-containing protein [Kitasatospora sp. NPDC051853]|uniref:trypsin-like serine peptidase n=1 Tax=Kitasatospora sp. NPDC051853 TaxID=3364058 RepID=UPI0037A3D480